MKIMITDVFKIPLQTFDLQKGMWLGRTVEELTKDFATLDSLIKDGVQLLNDGRGSLAGIRHEDGGYGYYGTYESCTFNTFDANLSFAYQRLETDDEYNKRLKQEAAKKANRERNKKKAALARKAKAEEQKKQELELLEKLKKKYG